MTLAIVTLHISLCLVHCIGVVLDPFPCHDVRPSSNLATLSDKLNVNELLVSAALTRPTQNTADKMHTMTKEHVQRLWREADAVCFDVDSTVCVDEAIDELAEFCGVGPQVAAFTVKAMGGGITFREALTQRLDIMKPTRKIVDSFIAANPPRFSHGIRELIDTLRAKNKTVFLVSGGFHSIIAPVGEELGIPQENIFANRLLFNEDGSFAGFDTDELTSETGGKPRVVQHIKDKYAFKTLVFVGDGVTDMETCPPADAFIGYGGNVVRCKVKEGAAWYITDFRQLIDELLDNESYLIN